MNRCLSITGAGGFLGSRICEYPSGRDGYEAAGVTHRELGIEDFVAVPAFVKAVRPDYVLHCAAISNTGTCERNPVPSERANARGTVSPAKACRKADSCMIFISLDQIYNISHSLESNREGSEGESGSVYRRDKERMEEATLTCLPDVVILRPTQLHDTSSGSRVVGRGLLQKLTDALKGRWEVEFPVHDYRGITYVWEVMCHLEEATGLSGGVCNFEGENWYDTFDTARLFLRGLTGGDFGSILRCDDKCFVSCLRNLAMNTDKIRSHGMQFFSTPEGIHKYCLEHREMSQVWCQEAMERTYYTNRRNTSPQAIKVCGLILLCLVVMFGVAMISRAGGGERLVSEYTVQDKVPPRHMKLESTPTDMLQMTAAWFYKYKSLGQLRRLLSGRAVSSPEFLLWVGKPGCGRDGRYLSRA